MPPEKFVMSLVPPVTNRFPPETSGEDMLLKVMGAEILLLKDPEMQMGQEKLYPVELYL